MMNLSKLLEQLQKENDFKTKLQILNQFPAVSEYLKQNPKLKSSFEKLDIQAEYILKCLVAIGQAEIIFQGQHDFTVYSHHFEELVSILKEVESFYKGIGGVIGYHMTVLKLIQDKSASTHDSQSVNYLEPEGENIAQLNSKVRQMIKWGLESLPQLGEIYPVGGAGDRLDLREESSGRALPAAELNFNGMTLLAGLIRDLEAREYLFYKIMGKQLITPVAMMTSQEKDNHHLILEICEANEWFNRPRESFKLFMQPLVPVITIEGEWAVTEPFKLLLKPGGHGVIWKLAEDAGVFNWFESQGRSKAIVRQINNPVAGVDYGLIAFEGMGVHENKKFGFASCDRLLNTAEGMDVLLEMQKDNGFEYAITNIEYTEFKEKGIHDIPKEANSQYSKFPANTNILFIDISAVRQVLKQCSLPGKLINMKSAMSCLDRHGKMREIKAGRLETVMQNIADNFVDRFGKRLPEEQHSQLSTYITFNERRKTISVTKKSYAGSGSIVESPEGCFYELLQNSEELLKQYCFIQVPEVGNESDFVKFGPAFIFVYHPALGPIYEVISQKIKNGKFAKGSELRLEIAEIEIDNLNLDGSFQIFAEDIMGHKNPENELLRYSHESSKCILKNVTVRNEGIDFAASNIYWKNQIKRYESLIIEIGSHAEFYAENVIFNEGQTIVVPAHHRAIAYQNGQQIHIELERIEKPSWYWEYFLNEHNAIVLKKSSQYSHIKQKKNVDKQKSVDAHKWRCNL